MDDQWILTAAHCVHGKLDKTYKVTAAATESYPSSIPLIAYEVDVDKVFMHEVSLMIILYSKAMPQLLFDHCKYTHTCIFLDHYRIIQDFCSGVL